MRINVLGVGFDNVTMQEAVDRGMELLHSEGTHYVVTPNPEIVEACREDAEVMRIVNAADLVLADGIGVIKGAAMLGTPLKEKVPGVEFAANLMERMAGVVPVSAGGKARRCRTGRPKPGREISRFENCRKPRWILQRRCPCGGCHPRERRRLCVCVPWRSKTGTVDGQKRP